MTYLKLFFIGLIALGALVACSPGCEGGDLFGYVNECSTTTETADSSASDGGSSGGSTGGSTGGSSGGSTGGVADTTAPTISSYTPSESATNIAIGSNLTVTFNEAMDTSTINSTNITLANSGSNVTATMALSGNTATINPASDLNYGTTYTWTVGTGVKDSAGNALASAVTYTFTTSAETTPPTISSYTPSNSATNIAIGDNLTVTFNEAMDTSTINNTTITLSTGGNSVATTVTLNGNTATINPTGNFTNYTTYTWTIGTGVQDAAGNALASAVTYTFTSGGGGVYNPGILTNRSRLSAGYNKVGYILDNGNVIEWGDRKSGSSSDNEPSNYYPVDNLTNARWISSFATSKTYSHSCAIKEDNTAVCWGSNKFGELGDSSVPDYSGCGRASSTTRAATACATPEFDNSSAQGNLEMVETGNSFTLWLDKNGTVYVSGRCDSGRLGLSCSSNQLTPKTVMTGVKDILASPTEGLWCAHKTDNTLWCTGENTGRGITNSVNGDVMTPVQIASNVEHFGIFATNNGSSGAIGIVYADNTVFCTDNYLSSSAKCPDKITETNIKQISGNGHHIMVVLDNGTTRAYGNNERGTMAHGSGGGDESSPITTVESSIHVDGTPMINMDYIVGGNDTFFGILDNGTLVGVGGNADNELVPLQQRSSAQCSWQGGSLTNITQADGICDRWMTLPIQKGDSY